MDGSNEDYAKQAYWDARYSQELSYDWFSTAYGDCVEAAFASVERVYEEQRAVRGVDQVAPLSVLHLGIGNSSLCEDLYKAYSSKYASGKEGDGAPYKLVQVAVDYSPVVIERMRERFAALPDTHWEVADVRDLSTVRAAHGPHFDLVIDKATMDAFQASKAGDVEENVAKMLTEVSQCLSEPVCASGSPTRFRRFVQMTWEVPYYRLYFTTKNEEHTYAWGTNVDYRFLGDSDVYRVYTYDVLPRVTP